MASEGSYHSSWFYNASHPVATLAGPGRYRVQLLLDGELVAQEAFDLYRRISVANPDRITGIARNIPWPEDSFQYHARIGRQLLAELYELDPAIAGSAARLPWVGDRPGIHDLAAMTRILMRLSESAGPVQLVGAKWVIDGLSEPERDLIGYVAEMTPELAAAVLQGLSQPGALEAWQDDHFRAIEQLSLLEDGEQATAIAGADWLRDGIDLAELGLLSAASYHSFERGDMANLSDQPASAPLWLSRRVSTARSEELVLSAFGDGLLHTDLGMNLLDAIEFTVRRLGDHLDLAWPYPDIAVLITGPEVDLGVGGFYVREFKSIGGGFAREIILEILFHELGHSFYHRWDESEWLQEGAPTYLERHVSSELGLIDMNLWHENAQANFGSNCLAGGRAYYQRLVCGTLIARGWRHASGPRNLPLCHGQLFPAAHSVAGRGNRGRCGSG